VKHKQGSSDTLVADQKLDAGCNHGRRRFLKTAGSAAALSALAPACSTFGNIYSLILDPGPDPLPPTGEYPDMPRATVAVSGVAGSVERAVREAVMASGGLEEIEPGQRVVIKPNATAPRATAEKSITTNPEVIRAVIRLVKERGAHPIVGDRSALLDEETHEEAGFFKVCEEEGVECFPWIKSEYVRFYPDQRYWTDGFRIPRVLAEADHFINVPVLKNHELLWAEFTCCLKAFVGVCHPEDRWQLGDNALHQKNVSEKIAELNLSVKPLLNVVDATSIMVSGGPEGNYDRGVWAQSDLVLAGRDRVATDSVALAVMKRHGAENNVERPYVEKSVWDFAQIYRSAELGIGQADPQMIKVEDVGVEIFDEIMDNWD